MQKFYQGQSEWGGGGGGGGNLDIKKKKRGSRHISHEVQKLILMAKCANVVVHAIV